MQYCSACDVNLSLFNYGKYALVALALWFIYDDRSDLHLALP